ncbi:hypothetical protein HYH03_000678 [Edaphochlamys debaryana]|uniref:Glutaredoxin domain-containing protein n=1 Tax=Edaphochlamys debaryana TaxID=47281 RepID=A0A835YJN3_9CHLO|nr:hypothetical protein HYH03_000678 [Edaphochlamys debaryana]|eukprot:KAG2502191.1 hypothetical protein HYH03_000678 [Edaphochlamys debaryana]
MAASATVVSGATAAEDAFVASVASAAVAVMTTPACPYCKRAKEALTGAGVPYVNVDVGGDEALRQAVREVSGSRTVPQVFVGGSSFGGCDSLLAGLADGSFTRALEAARAGAAPAVPPGLLERIRAAAASARGAEAAPSAGGDPRLLALAERLGRAPAQGGIARSDTAVGSRTLRTFRARALTDWLAAAGEADPAATVRALLAARLAAPAAADAAAADAAAAAVARGEGVSAGGGEGPLLMLTAEAPAPTLGEPLNVGFFWTGPARPASEVASSLRGLILELYDAHLSPDGRSVSYGAIRADPRFARFVAATAELQKVDLSPLPRSELMALGLNLYNALIVHALVALRMTRMGSAERATFFSRTAKYCIGGLDYTADDLEQGMLRGNRAGASNLFNLLGLHGLAGGHWRRDDPRAAKVVSPVDPRIHFALVCGAKSCPPIKLYAAANLEEGLAAAAEAFCGGEVAVDAAKREVRLSKIFKWYAVDFGASKLDRLTTIASFLAPPARREQLLALVADERAGRGNVRVSYSEYDWSLNGTD